MLRYVMVRVLEIKGLIKIYKFIKFTKYSKFTNISIENEF